MRTQRDRLMADLTQARKHFVKLRSADEFDKRFKAWRSSVQAHRIGMNSIETHGWTALSDDLAALLLDALLKAITDLQSEEAERLAKTGGLEVGTWD